MPTVDAIILNDRGEILLQQRSDMDIWGMPGGMMELKETVLEALEREVKEETNLEIEHPTLFGIYSGPEYEVTYENGDRLAPVKMVFLVTEYRGALTKDRESTDLRFFSFHDLPKRIHETHRRIIDDVRRKRTGEEKEGTPLPYAQ